MVKSLNDKNTSPLFIWLCFTLFALIAVRFVSLGLYPLFDMTESRYGEIARLMFETGNWVTPQIDYGQPFWGKPPLNTWASASAFHVFGVSEFSARLPHFLMGIVTSLVLFRFVQSQCSERQAWFSVFVLWSSLGFVLATGMVMTDSALLLSYTLAMCSFWLHFSARKTQLFGYLFFASLALGMLAKGPVMPVLSAIALILWSLWDKRFCKALVSLPWVGGVTLFLALTLPWYIWAEIRTPGFLQYFIVGEHFSRFIEPGWSGDLYGSAHDKPKGAIWLFALICAFPWSLWVLHWVVTSNKRRKRTESDAPSVDRYFVAWMCAPLILFTFAGNILPIYVLPGFSAMAVLLARHYSVSKWAILSAISTLLVLTAITVALSIGVIEHKSQNKILSHVSGQPSLPIYYWQKRPFSGQFYSGGKAKRVSTEQDLLALLNVHQSFVLISKRRISKPRISKQGHAKSVSVIDNHCKMIEQEGNHLGYVCKLEINSKERP